MSVDLEREVIEMPGEVPIPFQTDPRTRTKLLGSVDDLDEIRPHLETAATKRAEDERERPWVYQFREAGN
jgi:hypothetical protein